MVKFRCQCGQKIGVPDSYAGKRVRCPRCGNPARVPEATPGEMPSATVTRDAAVSPTPPATPKPIAPKQPAMPNSAVVAEAVAPKAVATEAPVAPKATTLPKAVFAPEAASAPLPPPASKAVAAPEPIKIVAPAAPPAEPAPVITGRVTQDFSAVFGAGKSVRPPKFSEHKAPQPLEEKVEQVAHGPSDFAGASAEAPKPQPEHEEQPEPDELEPEYSEPQQTTRVEFKAAASDVIDVPRPKRTYGLNSADEVADLLRGFDTPGEERDEDEFSGGPARTEGRAFARPAAMTIARAVAPAAMLEVERDRRFSVLGAAAIILALAAIALCWVPQVARYSMAVGAAGGVVALLALVLSLIRRRTSITLPIGGAVACALAVALPVLASYRLLPAGIIPENSTPTTVNLTPGSVARNLPSDGYVSALYPVQLGNLQVHIVSALIQQPVAYKVEDWKDYHSVPTRRLHITVELRDLGTTGQIVYRSWGQPDKSLEPPILTDAAGSLLKVIDFGSLVPLGRCAVPTTLYPNQDPISDVIIFERPTERGDLLLQLPGKNAGMPGKTIKFRIPEPMVEQN